MSELMKTSELMGLAREIRFGLEDRCVQPQDHIYLALTSLEFEAVSATNEATRAREELAQLRAQLALDDRVGRLRPGDHE